MVEDDSPELALGVSNVFEVEEQAPDGSSTEVDAPSRSVNDVVEDEDLDEPVDEDLDEPVDEDLDEPVDEDLDEPVDEDLDEDLGEAVEPAVGSGSPALVLDEDEEDEEPPPVLVWYVLKVQSGRENTIRDALERRVKIEGLQNCFGRLVVPTEKVTEIRNNKKKIVERKSYPGYIMVEMELNEKTWFLVRETPGVGDFVGAHGKPSAMSAEEVNKMLYQEEEQKPGEQPKVKIYVERGDRVKIKDGPFENFEGDVEEVVEARGLVKVMLIIFNRPTPVDLEYWQVERI